MRPTRLLALAAGVLAACSSAPPVRPVDQVVGITESTRRSLGRDGTGAAVSAPSGSVRGSEETVVRRAGTRREFTRARKEQDDAYKRSSDEVTFLELYVTTSRNDVEALYLHGRALGKLKRYVEAAECFELAKEADPKNPYPLEGLGICAFLGDRNDLAIVHLKRALDLDPDFADARYGLASALET
ncbi:MAG TPA: tetratricopeptide repeat protein, partial [Planctomycetota bacterium]|nr:tetratricopeptide repeat protein [Planctomycetota bacterium]